MTHRGYCPNCGFELAIDSAACETCGANFSSDSAWKPVGSKPLLERANTVPDGFWFILKLVVGLILLLAAGFLGLLAVMLAFEDGRLGAALHVSLIPLMTAYGVMFVFAATLGFLLVRGAIRGYKDAVPSDRATEKDVR